jgi:hypothetical protein
VVETGEGFVDKMRDWETHRQRETMAHRYGGRSAQKIFSRARCNHIARNLSPRTKLPNHLARNLLLTSHVLSPTSHEHPDSS